VTVATVGNWQFVGPNGVIDQKKHLKLACGGGKYAIFGRIGPSRWGFENATKFATVTWNKIVV
jgi:hypothetical protein